MPRDDFPEHVKRQAASRAGHCCSNPNCRAPTSGPQSGDDGGLNLGEAAHISAASPGGPRFDERLSPEERSGIQNAIWLCRICARRIDADRNAFPRELLVEWKRNAERAAANEIGRPREPPGLAPEALSDIKQVVIEALAESATRAQSWIDEQLESAVENIKAYRYEGARSLLFDLREKHWTGLSDQQRFRVLTNLAATYLGQGDNKRAANFYREAKVCQPNDQKAWENEALAHELLDEKSKAVELARKVRERWPESVRALGIILAELPPTATIEQLRNEIPSGLAEDPEICLVLSRRAAMIRNFAVAEEFARRAVSKLPDRAYAVFLVGQVLLASVLAESWKKHAEIAVDRGSPRVAETEDYLTRAISLAKEQKAIDIEAHALVTRSCLYEVKGDKPKWEGDVEEAYHLAPGHPPAAATYAALLHSRGDTDRAIAILRESMSSSGSDEGTFFLCNLLHERGSTEDLKEALSHLCRLAITPANLGDGFREHVASCAMYIAKGLNDFEQVDQLLNKIPEGVISPTGLQVLRVRLAIAHDRQKEANELADQALKTIPDDAPADDRRNLAMILCQLSRFNEALPIWERIAPKNILGNDTRYLLDCAMRAESYGVVLDVCRALRNAGVEDSELFETEMFVLERYAPAEALERLRREVLNRPDDTLLQLRLSVLGLRLNHPDLVISNVGKLPPPSEISPRDAMFAVAVLRSHGNTDDAVKYAYEVLRLYFNDVDAHRAYVSSMGPGQHPPTFPTSEAMVATGCAIRFIGERSSEEQWVIIEDCANPDPSRFEISPDSSLAKELLGKRIEDSFEISPFARGIIKEITSKFVFRYQDCFRQWQFRFSDQAEIMSFQVGATGFFENDFEPILTMMRARRTRTEEVERFYASHSIPIHFVSKALNVDDFVALAGLAGSPDVLIRCCDGSALERETALKVLDERSRIVLDVTAIGSLIILDRLDLFDTVPFTVIVSSGTVAVFEEMLRNEESKQEHTVGLLGETDGRPRFTEITEEDKQRQIKELRLLLEAITNRCEVRDSGQLAYIATEKRSQLIELFGHHGAESIVLASESRSALWTDDLTVAVYARETFGCPRVWTHLVLQYLRRRGSLDEGGYLDATARLAGWGYFFTSINEGAVITAGRIADWNPDKWPLKQCLHYLQVETVPLQEVVNLTNHLIVKIHREDLLPERKNSLMIAMLENLVRRDGGFKAIIAIRRTLPTTFGLDVVSSYRAAKTIDAWLAAKKQYASQDEYSVMSRKLQ